MAGVRGTLGVRMGLATKVTRIAKGTSAAKVNSGIRVDHFTGGAVHTWLSHTGVNMLTKRSGKFFCTATRKKTTHVQHSDYKIFSD